MKDKIKEILSNYKTIAMVGVSKDEKKPSTKRSSNMMGRIVNFILKNFDHECFEKY